MWRAAFDLSLGLYRVSSTGALARDFGLKDQMRRAAVSVLSNIAEGFERNGDREFSQFLYLAKASCGELRAQLHLSRGLEYLDEDAFRDLLRKALDISRMLSALIDSLRRSDFEGDKYRPDKRPAKKASRSPA